MAKITTGSTFGLTARQTAMCRMMVMGTPGFAECYRAMIKEMAWPVYGEAIDIIRKQLNHSNGWLANKAANDLLNRFAPVVMGEDSKAITVKIEGMPELGTPNDE